jgi:hypothetical protein
MARTGQSARAKDGRMDEISVGRREEINQKINNIILNLKNGEKNYEIYAFTRTLTLLRIGRNE